MTTNERIQHLGNLVTRLAGCRKLEHGDIVPDEEMTALILTRDLLLGAEPPIDSGGKVIEESQIA